MGVVWVWHGRSMGVAWAWSGCGMGMPTRSTRFCRVLRGGVLVYSRVWRACAQIASGGHDGLDYVEVTLELILHFSPPKNVFTAHRLSTQAPSSSPPLTECHAPPLPSPPTLQHNLEKFTESVARFYVGEIILAFEYLHSRNIIFR